MINSVAWQYSLCRSHNINYISYFVFSIHVLYFEHYCCCYYYYYIIIIHLQKISHESLLQMVNPAYYGLENAEPETLNSYLSR